MEGLTHLDLTLSTADTDQADFVVIDPVTSSEQTSELVLPSGPDYLLADFGRDGHDLLLKPAVGETVIVPGYFFSESPPALVLDGGAVLTFDLVAKLAGPALPGQYAQAVGAGDGLGVQALGAPIGSVTELQGNVNATRADGTQVNLGQGAAIHQGDVIETGPDGSVGIVFADDTTFSLAADGRMVMDEMIYDPDTQTGTFEATVVKGVFSFVSGQVAKTGTDAMSISTPGTTIGIRGSTGLVKTGVDDGGDKIALVPDVDGNVGELTVSTVGGTLVLNLPNASTVVLDPTQPPSQMTFLSAQDIQADYGQTLTVLIRTEAKKAETKADEAEQQAQAAEQEAASAEAEAGQAEQNAADAEAEAAAAEAQAAAAEAEAEALAAEAEALAAEAEALAAQAATDPEAAAAAAEAQAAADAAAAAAQAADAAAQAEAQTAAAAVAAADAAAAEATTAAEAAAAAEAQAAAAAAAAQDAAQFSQLAGTAAATQEQAFAQFVETGIVGDAPPADEPFTDEPPIDEPVPGDDPEAGLADPAQEADVIVEEVDLLLDLLGDLVGTSGDDLLIGDVEDILDFLPDGEDEEDFLNFLDDVLNGDGGDDDFEPDDDFGPDDTDEPVIQTTIAAGATGGTLSGGTEETNYYFDWNVVKTGSPTVSYNITDDGGNNDQISFDSLDGVTLHVNFGADPRSGTMYVYQSIDTGGLGSVHAMVTFSGIEWFAVSDQDVSGLSDDNFFDIDPADLTDDVEFLDPLGGNETGYLVVGTANADTITINAAADGAIAVGGTEGDTFEIKTTDVRELTVYGGHSTMDNVDSDMDGIPDTYLNSVTYANLDLSGNTEGLWVSMSGDADGETVIQVTDADTQFAFGHTLYEIGNFTGSSKADAIEMHSGMVLNTLDGGSGDDTITVNEGALVAKIETGSGNDTLTIAGTAIETLTHIKNAGGADSLTIDIASAAVVDMSGITFVNSGTYSSFTYDAAFAVQGITLTATDQAETINGSAHGDTITAGAGDDMITLGNGNNTVVGGAGADTITAGSGVDIFQYDAVSESNNSTRDIINGFATGQDKIDISGLSTIGSFNFLGLGGSFTGDSTNTEANVVVDSTHWLLQIDINADGLIDGNDVVIQLDTSSIAAGDFVLT